MIQFELEGVDNLLKNIERKTASQKRGVKNQISKSGLTIETNAKRRVPVDTGRLKSSVRARFTDEGLSALVGTEVEYAPYIEFGTASKVDVPVGLEEFAMQFFKGGGGVGINARPFLFPSVEEEKPKLVKGIKEALK